MDKNRLRDAARNNIVTIMFIVLCAVCMAFSGYAPNYVLYELFGRLSRNMFIVLSLIIPIVAGMGINFAITIGAMAAQIACLLVLEWGVPGIGGLALAALLEPAVVLCRRRLHLRRGFTATVLSLVVLGTVAAGLVLLAMVLLRQVCELSGRLPGYLEVLPRWTELVRGRAQQLCAACPEGLRSWLEALLDGLSAQLAELLESMGQRCLRAVTAAAAALPQAVLFCATTLLAVLFTAGSYPRIRAFLRRQLPEDRLRQARGVKADLLATLGKWCKAQCILLGVTFCELLAGLLLLRQGYALLLAALIAVIDALPVFGTGTVLVPWGALCLLTGNVPKGLGLLALYGVISLVRSVLEPKIMAAQVDLPPLAALAAMYVGFCAFGVAGMVLCPMALLFVKQLHDSGWLRLWK